MYPPALLLMDSAAVRNAAMNVFFPCLSFTSAHVSAEVESRSRICVSCSVERVRCFSSNAKVSQSDCMNLHTHQQLMRVLIVAHFGEHVVSP